MKRSILLIAIFTISLAYTAHCGGLLQAKKDDSVECGYDKTQPWIKRYCYSNTTTFCCRNND